MSTQNTRWRWTFHYILNRKITLSNWSLSPNVKLVKDGNSYVTGFEIVTDKGDENGREQASNNIARIIVQKLSAESKEVISYILTGAEGKSSDPNRPGKVRSISTHRYNIEGAAPIIDEIDLTDITATSSNEHNNLQHLYEAISHFRSDRYKECISAAFKVIEGRKNLPSYGKYRCIRDIVNHKENQVWRNGTVHNFDYYFGPSVFDFEEPYDKANKIIVIDFDSHKSIETLKKMSDVLIDEAKLALS